MLCSCTRLVLSNLCQQCFDGLLLFWICFSFQKQIVTKTYDNHWRRHNVCWAKRVKEVHQTIAVLSAVIWITCFFLILYVFRYVQHLISLCRSSHRRCSTEKGVLRNFGKFTETHWCQSLFFSKVAGPQASAHLRTTASDCNS